MRGYQHLHVTIQYYVSTLKSLFLLFIQLLLSSKHCNHLWQCVHFRGSVTSPDRCGIRLQTHTLQMLSTTRPSKLYFPNTAGVNLHQKLGQITPWIQSDIYWKRGKTVTTAVDLLSCRFRVKYRHFGLFDLPLSHCHRPPLFSPCCPCFYKYYKQLKILPPVRAGASPTSSQFTWIW